MRESVALRRWSSAILVAAAVAAVSRPAMAQEWLVAGRAAFAGGVDGGGVEGGPRRARSVATVGVDLSVDERPRDVVGVAALVEIEPRASFGGEVRFGRRFGTRSLAFAAGEAFLAPHTLFGAGAGFEQGIGLVGKTALTLAPTFQVFFVGQDLPDDRVFWRAVLALGFRADL